MCEFAVLDHKSSFQSAGQVFFFCQYTLCLFTDSLACLGNERLENPHLALTFILSSLPNKFNVISIITLQTHAYTYKYIIRSRYGDLNYLIYIYRYIQYMIHTHTNTKFTSEFTVCRWLMYDHQYSFYFTKFIFSDDIYYQ